MRYVSPVEKADLFTFITNIGEIGITLLFSGVCVNRWIKQILEWQQNISDKTVESAWSNVFLYIYTFHEWANIIKSITQVPNFMLSRV